MTKQENIQRLDDISRLKENWNGYGEAVEIKPNVLWTHAADMYAARVQGV